MADIKITLETLYDMLRNEKKREDLQKLEETFFLDVVNYLKEKQTLLESKSNDNELFAAGERDKLDYELRSIKRILKELYEKREKKIIEIALNKSRTGSDIIDTSAMLSEEKDFYNKLLLHLDIYRKGVLGNLFKGELPVFIGGEVRQEKKVEEEPTTPTPEESTTEKEKSTIEESEQQMTKVKFIRPMPSFVWKDMKVYGPFEKDEETEIFPEVADLIVRKGRAEKV